jgi:hypothetical protein
MPTLKTAEDAGKDLKLTSQLLGELAADIDDAPQTVGAFVDWLSDRGVGFLLLILSLPMCIPNIPGISTLFGALLIAPSLQMVLCLDHVWLPQFIRKWQLNPQVLRGSLRACSAFLSRVEVLSRPRLHVLTGRLALTLFGLQALIMAIVLIVPMPGANLLPGIAGVLLGLGILQKDGLFMLASIPFAIASVAWVTLGAKVSVDFVLWLYRAGANLLSGT